jgi:adenylate kinase
MEQPQILLLGPPGAGKGTQSANITDRYHIDHIETRSLLQANEHIETEYGTPRDFIEQGDLVPDPIVNELVEETISESDGFVLDGYPRTLSQAENLDDLTHLDAVLLLRAGRDNLIERMTGRRVCPACGATYHVEFSPPETDGVCDECGSDLVQREDDTEAAINERLDVYEEKTTPIHEFYRERDDFVEIDGEQPPDEVWHDLRLALVDTLA